MTYRSKSLSVLSALAVLGLSACAKPTDADLAMIDRGYIPAGAKCFQIASGIEQQQKAATRMRTQAEVLKVNARDGNRKAAKKARKYEKLANRAETNAVFNSMLLRGAGPC